MSEVTWSHRYSEANGIRVHYVRHGERRGTTVVLLHGWPEFWYAYRKNIPVLAERFDVIVPDLRASGTPTNPDCPIPRVGCSTRWPRT